MEKSPKPLKTGATLSKSLKGQVITECYYDKKLPHVLLYKYIEQSFTQSHQRIKKHQLIKATILYKAKIQSDSNSFQEKDIRKRQNSINTSL